MMNPKRRDAHATHGGTEDPVRGAAVSGGGPFGSVGAAAHLSVVGHRPGGVLAAGVYWVADKRSRPRTVLVEQPYQTGSQDLDELLAQAQTRLDQLHTLNERIPTRRFSAAILHGKRAAILEKLSAEPGESPQRPALSGLLPAHCRKVLTAYADLEAAGADGERRALAAQVEQNAGTIARAL